MKSNAALLVIDVQKDFCAGGALAVPAGEEIVPLINAIAADFSTVVMTQDWHPAGHASFAATHPSRKEFEVITMPYGPQVLWPTHCVMATLGAEFYPGLAIPHASLIIRKGSHMNVDSYSAFLEADRTTKTGLDGYLSARGITDVYVCGLALDFCVGWSAEDAASFGFTTSVIEDACRAINLDSSLELTWDRLRQAGVGRLRSTELTRR
jgi:nicotinamidase/pyrazinamidase